MVGPTSSESSDQMPCNITSIRSCSSRSSAQLATSEPHRIDAPRLQLTIFTGASCWPFSSLLVVRILLRIRTNCLYHSWVFDPRLWFFRLSMPSYLKRPKLSHAEPTSAHRTAKRNWIGHPALAAAICWSSCCESFKTLQQKRSQKCWKHCSQIQ